jgi:hypothetical protein
MPQTTPPFGGVPLLDVDVLVVLVEPPAVVEVSVFTPVVPPVASVFVA